MGLLYQLPNCEDELDDRIQVGPKLDDQTRLRLKTYGLPYIFWGYMAAVLVVIFFLYLAARLPIQKLIDTGDSVNMLLGYAVLATLGGIPLVLLGLFFYEKEIQKNGNLVTIIQKIFWLPFSRKTYQLEPGEALVISHFMDSPNVAAIQDRPEMQGFKNRGYHELFMLTSCKQRILIDRSSRAHDIKKLKELLERY